MDACNAAELEGREGKGKEKHNKWKTLGNASEEWDMREGHKNGTREMESMKLKKNRAADLKPEADRSAVAVAVSRIDGQKN